MIKTFKNALAEDIFNGTNTKTVKKLPPTVVKVARRKLDMLNSAVEVSDLLVPPRNRLEALKGDRKGQFSIRINDQWRLCFTWVNGHAIDAEIIDYH
ncbi:MAG: type II toxin-antitoxin system RelE/ParE family toxin [Vampirovibrio sp.]|nr:type II toxin-antitoxin system RelE/ParE family toxin [Vampirovibrio sp.]